MLLPGLEFAHVTHIVNLLRPVFYSLVPEERTIILHLVTIVMAAYNLNLGFSIPTVK